MPSIERMQRLRMFDVSLLVAILSVPLAASALGCVLYFLHCLETNNRAMGKAVKRLSTPRISVGSVAVNSAVRRMLPMTPRVRNILEARWESAGKPGESWVWPAPTRSGHVEVSSLGKQHAKAIKASKVRPFVLYSLRHTFLTRLGESGCDVWTLARIAGHSSITISSRYVHPSQDAVLDAMSRMGEHKIGHTQESAEQEENVRLLTQ